MKDKRSEMCRRIEKRIEELFHKFSGQPDEFEYALGELCRSLCTTKVIDRFALICRPTPNNERQLTGVTMVRHGINNQYRQITVQFADFKQPE